MASSCSAALGAGRAGPSRATAPASHGGYIDVRPRPACGAGAASSGHRGGLGLRRRRWTGPSALLAGWADSDKGVICNGAGADPLFRPAAHVSWVLTESGDIGSGGAGRGSVLNGRCAEGVGLHMLTATRSSPSGRLDSDASCIIVASQSSPPFGRPTRLSSKHTGRAGQVPAGCRGSHGPAEGGSGMQTLRPVLLANSNLPCQL